MNQLRLSDHALNPSGGWPVATTDLYLINIPVPSSSYLYSLQPGTPAAPGRFDTNSPAESTPVTGYPASSGAGGLPVFADNGVKMYVANLDLDTISIVNTATNSHTGTISTLPDLVNITLGSDGRLYALTESGAISVIDMSSDTIVDTINVSCPTVGSLGFAVFPAGETFFYASCATDGIIRKVDIASGTTIGTIDISSVKPTISSFSLTPDNKKMYIAGIYGNPDSDEVVVYDVVSGNSEVIPLTAATFGPILSPDGQLLYVGTQGGFDTMNIDVISTQTDAIIDTIDTSSVGVPGMVSGISHTSAEASLSFMLGSASNDSNTSSANTLANTGSPQLILLMAASLGLITVTVLVVVAQRRTA